MVLSIHPLCYRASEQRVIEKRRLHWQSLSPGPAAQSPLEAGDTSIEEQSGAAVEMVAGDLDVDTMAVVSVDDVEPAVVFNDTVTFPYLYAFSPASVSRRVTTRLDTSVG